METVVRKVEPAVGLVTLRLSNWMAEELDSALESWVRTVGPHLSAREVLVQTHRIHSQYQKERHDPFANSWISSTVRTNPHTHSSMPTRSLPQTRFAYC